MWVASLETIVVRYTSLSWSGMCSNSAYVGLTVGQYLDTRWHTGSAASLPAISTALMSPTVGLFDNRAHPISRVIEGLSMV